MGIPFEVFIGVFEDRVSINCEDYVSVPEKYILEFIDFVVSQEGKVLIQDLRCGYYSSVCDKWETLSFCRKFAYKPVKGDIFELILKNHGAKFV